MALTSVGDKDGLILCLHIVLAAIRGRECHPVLAGVKLTVDLGTGPRQHLTESKEQHSYLCFKPELQQAGMGRRATLCAQLHAGLEERRPCFTVTEATLTVPLQTSLGTKLTLAC